MVVTSRENIIDTGTYHHCVQTTISEGTNWVGKHDYVSNVFKTQLFIVCVSLELVIAVFGTDSILICTDHLSHSCLV